jgi:hypothetical protein
MDEPRPAQSRLAVAALLVWLAFTALATAAWIWFFAWASVRFAR